MANPLEPLAGPEGIEDNEVRQAFKHIQQQLDIAIELAANLDTPGALGVLARLALNLDKILE